MLPRILVFSPCKWISVPWLARVWQGDLCCHPVVFIYFWSRPSFTAACANLSNFSSGTNNGFFFSNFFFHSIFFFTPIPLIFFYFAFLAFFDISCHFFVYSGQNFFHPPPDFGQVFVHPPYPKTMRVFFVHEDLHIFSLLVLHPSVTVHGWSKAGRNATKHWRFIPNGQKLFSWRERFLVGRS